MLYTYWFVIKICCTICILVWCLIKHKYEVLLSYLLQWPWLGLQNGLQLKFQQFIVFNDYCAQQNVSCWQELAAELWVPGCEAASWLPLIPGRPTGLPQSACTSAHQWDCYLLVYTGIIISLITIIISHNPFHICI